MTRDFILKEEKLRLDVRKKFFTKGGEALHCCPVLWVPNPWRCPRPWRGPGQLELGVPSPWQRGREGVC